MVEFLKAKPTSFINKPRGLINVDTGASQVGEAITRMGNTITQIAYENAVTEQKEVGDTVGKTAKLPTRNEKGELQFTELPADLSVVAKNSANTIIEQRYAKFFQRDVATSLNNLRIKYRQDPKGFELASGVLIESNIKELEANGYGKYSSELLDSSSYLASQHVLDIKTKEYARQEDLTNESDKAIVSTNISEIYTLQQAGETKAADQRIKETLAVIETLRGNSAVNQPWIDDKLSIIKTNGIQTRLEKNIQSFNGNHIAAGHLASAFKNRGVNDINRNILNHFEITDEYIKELNEGLSLTEKTKLSAYLTSISGGMSKGADSRSKLADSAMLKEKWNNKGIDNTDTKTTKQIDSFVAENLGFNASMEQRDYLSLNPQQLGSLEQSISLGSVLPHNLKNVLTNGNTVLAMMLNNPKEANAIGEKWLNLHNLATANNNGRGLSDSEIFRAEQIRERVRINNDYQSAFDIEFRTIDESKDYEIDRMTSIKKLDATTMHKSSREWVKGWMSTNFPEWSGDIKNDLEHLVLDALEKKDADLSSIQESLNTTYDKIYIEDDTNFNLRNGSGEASRESIGVHYTGATLETVKKNINYMLEVSGEVDSDGDPFVLGDTAFLLGNKRNSTVPRADARWTVVRKDGTPIIDSGYGDELQVSTLTLNKFAKQFEIDEAITKVNESKSNRELIEKLHKGTDTFWDRLVALWESSITGEGGPSFYAPERLTTQIDKENTATSQMISESDIEDNSQRIKVAKSKERLARISKLRTVSNFVKNNPRNFVRGLPDFEKLVVNSNVEEIDTVINSPPISNSLDAYSMSVKNLIADEGFSSIQYQDGAGKSVGYGFAIASLEPDELSLISDINNISKPEANAVLNLKVAKIFKKFNRDVPNFATLTMDRQVAIVNFAYQLGYENVTAQGPDPTKNWPKFFNSLKLASNESLGSDERESGMHDVALNMFYNFKSDGSRFKTFWANQTPSRARDVFTTVRGF